MKKLKVLMLLGVALLIVACGPVEPKALATDATVEKALEWVGTAFDNITEEELNDSFAKTTDIFQDGVITMVREVKINGARTLVDVKLDIVEDPELEEIVINGTLDIKFDGKSAIFVAKNLTRNGYSSPHYNGSVWYIPSDGDGFVALDAEHLDLFYSIGYAFF